jgi:hypothetical protein
MISFKMESAPKKWKQVRFYWIRKLSKQNTTFVSKLMLNSLELNINIPLIYPHLGHVIAFLLFNFFNTFSSVCVFCRPSNLGFLIFPKYIIRSFSSRRIRAHRWKKHQTLTYSSSRVLRKAKLRQLHAKTWKEYVENFILHKSNIEKKEYMGKLEFPMVMSVK